MGLNIYYLELIFILVNVFQHQKMMKKDILTETLFWKKKDKKHQKNNLVVNLLELIHVMQKMVMIQIIRLVMYRNLLMSSKIIKKKEKQLIKKKEMREKQGKELREMREEVEKTSKDKNKKLKHLTNNQVSNNFGKLIIKN